ncbi:TPA: hypothetical protein WM132_002220, partial [Neisseria gonorrhoeae]
SGLSGCGGAFADAADALRFAVFAALKNACSAAPAAVPLMPDAVFEPFVPES